MAANIDDPTGVDWNDAAANERERVGIIPHIIVRFDLGDLPGLLVARNMPN